MGSANRKGEVIVVTSVVQVGKLAKVSYSDSKYDRFCFIDKMSPVLRAMMR